ncbi:hypothetical protein PT2222_50242 [Paraburkholderia tropica]
MNDQVKRGSERSSTLVSVGIRRGTKLYAQWSPRQRESFPETVLQIAFVSIGNRIERIAVDHDDRRVLSPLVRVAQFRANRTAAARLLEFHRFDQRARETRRRQLGHGSGVGVVHRAHERADAELFRRRNEVHLGEIEEFQLALQVVLGAVACVVVHAVPLVHAHHQRTALLDHEARDMRVLVGDFLVRIEQQNHHVSVGDRLQRLHDRELLDGFEHLAATAQAGRVDQRVLLAVALEIHIDRIARRAGHVERDHAIFADQRVHERRLADVRATDDRDFHAVLAGVVFVLFRTIGVGLVERLVDHFGHAVAVRSRNRARVAEAEFVKVGGHGTVFHAFGLVDHEEDRTAGLAQVIGDVLVLRREAVAAVADEDDDIGFFHGLTRLARHFMQDAVLRDGFETARVDDQIRAIAHAPFAVVAVARETGQIGHQRIARTREPVEERGFPHIGAPDEGDNGFHLIFSTVRRGAGTSGAMRGKRLHGSPQGCISCKLSRNGHRARRSRPLSSH